MAVPCLLLMAAATVRAAENDTIRISYVWDFAEQDANGDYIWEAVKIGGTNSDTTYCYSTKAVQVPEDEHGDTCLLLNLNSKLCSFDTSNKLVGCRIKMDKTYTNPYTIKGIQVVLLPGWTCNTYFYASENTRVNMTARDDDMTTWDAYYYSIASRNSTLTTKISYTNIGNIKEYVTFYKNGNTFYLYCDYVKIISPALLPIATTSTYSTYCSKYNLDFTYSNDIEAYKAKVSEKDGEQVLQLTRVYQVEAGTGIILKTQEGGCTANVAVIPNDSTPTYDNSDNELIGVNGDTEISYTSSGSDLYNYVLKKNDSVMVKAPVEAAYLRANKAYLKTSYNAGSNSESSAKSMRIVIIDKDQASESSGIKVTPAEAVIDGRTFTLSGIQTNKPGKGIYIRNGKKIINNK